MHNTFSFFLLIHLCEDGNDALIVGLGWEYLQRGNSMAFACVRLLQK